MFARAVPIAEPAALRPASWAPPNIIATKTASITIHIAALCANLFISSQVRLTVSVALVCNSNNVY